MSTRLVAVVLIFAAGLGGMSTARAAKPDAKLTKVKVTFVSHDDNKDFNTRLDVKVKNRATLFLSQDLAEGSDLGKNTEFKDKPSSSHSFDLELKSKDVTLKDVTLPTYSVNIQPVGKDRWIFDVTVTLEFDDGSSFSSEKKGIILDQDNREYSGVFEPK